MVPSSADAYQALTAYKAPDPNAVLTQAQTQYGVPGAQTRVSDLRSAVNNLTSSINAVDPSVTGRTSGTFTTEAQRGALVSKEQQPLQTDLTARNTDLSGATQDFNTASANAGSLASLLLASGKDQYQKLLDQYNASTAYEKQQTDQQNAVAAQQLEQQKLAESTREFNNPQTTVASPTLGGSSSSSGSNTDPVQQAAYNDVYTRISKNASAATLISDYNATAKSAGFGNLQDQYKVQIYKQLRPDLFGKVSGYNQVGLPGLTVNSGSPGTATNLRPAAPSTLSVNSLGY